MAIGTRGLAIALVLALLTLAPSARAQVQTPADAAPPLTDAALDAAFRCPEALAGDDQRRQALVDYFHWVQARHPDWSVADAIEFKKALMIRHQCTASLRDLADYAKHE